MQGMLDYVLIGTVAKEPKYDVMQNGTARLSLDIVVNRKTKVKGSWEERAVWVRLSVWAGRAEALKGKLSKGAVVACKGAIWQTPYEISGKTLQVYRFDPGMEGLSIIRWGNEDSRKPEQQPRQNKEADDSQNDADVGEIPDDEIPF